MVKFLFNSEVAFESYMHIYEAVEWTYNSKALKMIMDIP